MDENYRLFFNIKIPELEVMEEETDDKGRLEEEEKEDEEYEDELDEFEDQVLQKDKVVEVEADEGLTGGEKEKSAGVQTHGASITVSVSSTRWPTAQLSTLEITQAEPKPDTEQESELAIFLQSLTPAEEPEDWGEVEPQFETETKSEVGTLWAGNCELDQYSLRSLVI